MCCSTPAFGKVSTDIENAAALNECITIAADLSLGDFFHWFSIVSISHGELSTIPPGEVILFNEVHYWQKAGIF